MTQEPSIDEILASLDAILREEADAAGDVDRSAEEIEGAAIQEQQNPETDQKSPDSDESMAAEAGEPDWDSIGDEVDLTSLPEVLIDDVEIQEPKALETMALSPEDAGANVSDVPVDSISPQGMDPEAESPKAIRDAGHAPEASPEQVQAPQSGGQPVRLLLTPDMLVDDLQNPLPFPEEGEPVESRESTADDVVSDAVEMDAAGESRFVAQLDGLDEAWVEALCRKVSERLELELPHLIEQAVRKTLNDMPLMQPESGQDATKGKNDESI